MDALRAPIGPFSFRVQYEYATTGTDRTPREFFDGAGHTEFRFRSAFATHLFGSGLKLSDLLLWAAPERVFCPLGTETAESIPLTPAFAEAIAGGNYVLLVEPGRVAVFDLKRRMGEEILASEDLLATRRRVPLSVQHTLAYFLPVLGVGQLHSAGMLAASGQVLIAFGPSGVGKTTTSRLARPRYHVLGDDRVVVWRKGDRVMAGASCFDAASDGAGEGPVGALLQLKHGDTFALRRIRWVDVLPNVWRDNYIQWLPFPPLLRTQVFNLYCDLFSKVPIFEMTFTRDFIDWDMVEDVVAAAQG